MISCHWVPTQTRHVGCYQHRCWGCHAGFRLDEVPYFAALTNEPNPRAIVAAITYDALAQVLGHEECGPSWRGLVLTFKRTPGQPPQRLMLESIYRTSKELPPDWDVLEDLEHVWRSLVPRQKLPEDTVAWENAKKEQQRLRLVGGDQ